MTGLKEIWESFERTDKSLAMYRNPKQGEVGIALYLDHVGSLLDMLEGNMAEADREYLEEMKR